MSKAPNWPPNFQWRVFLAILKTGLRFVHKMSGKFVPEKLYSDQMFSRKIAQIL